MLAWTKQIKCRESCEQPNDIPVATESYDIKLIFEITGIHVNRISIYRKMKAVCT